MPYRHLSLQERHVIHHLTVYGLSHREIARRLGRHHSTISREVKRNGPLTPGLSPYIHFFADKRAQQRKRMANHHRRGSCEALKEYVFDALSLHWSPEQISGRLKIDFPRNPQMRISPETIYQWIFMDAASGGEIYRNLRSKHRKRRHQKRYGLTRARFQGRVSITERPKIADRRGRYGDWEVDTMLGGRGSPAIATHVDRKSRYLLTALLKDRTAKTFADQTIRLFATIPTKWQRTLTTDNGSEFAQFAEIERQTGLTVYFADPYSAWQRPTNENTNGLLRQYFPKGTSLADLSEDRLEMVTQSLNHRPRKCLGYRTPHEVLYKVRCGALAT